MKGNRFTLLTKAVPILVCLLLVALSVPALAVADYIVESRDTGQNYGGYSDSMSDSGSPNCLAPGCTAIGSRYASAATAGKWAQYSYTPPIGAAGYYNVYAAWIKSTNGWWSIDYLLNGVTKTTWNQARDGTVRGATGGAKYNIWNKLNASNVRLSAGVASTVYQNPTPGVTTWPDGTPIGTYRMLAAAAKWVYVATDGPTGLTAQAVGGTEIDLSWTAPSPALTEPVVYHLERSDVNNTSYQDMTGWSGVTITGTTAVDTTGACDVTYFYRVKAVDGDGITSNVSNEVSLLRCANGAPAVATDPVPGDGAVAIHTDLANLSWTVGSATATQDVYFGTNSASLPRVALDLGPEVTTYAPGAMAANTTYYWRVDEKNSAGTTTGFVWSFTTGISLTVVPVRSASRGSIYWYSAGLENYTNEGRAWNATTWHAAGDVINLEVTAPDDPVTFSGWSLNADGTLPFDTHRGLYSWADPANGNVANGFVMPSTNANLNLYAVYALPHRSLTLTAVPAGAATSLNQSNQTWPSAGPTEYEAGDIAHLVATPAPGYVFAGWSTDKAGTFDDVYASTANYTMSADDTAVTAYFAHVVSNITDPAPLTIYANDINGAAGSDATTVNVRIGAQTPTILYARTVLFPPLNTDGTAKNWSIPAASLRNYSDMRNVGRLVVGHTGDGSYTGTSSVMGSIVDVAAYPITTQWMGSMAIEGATWLRAKFPQTPSPVDTPWTTPGGDMDTVNSLGTVSFIGAPKVGETYLTVPRTWLLPVGPDYPTLLANGIELKAVAASPAGSTTPVAPGEGDIHYRKGINGAALKFAYDPPTGAGSGVVKDWAYLGFYPQGVADDNQARIDTDQVAAGGPYNGVPVDVTTLAPNVGSALGAYTWTAGSSSTDLIDLLGASFYNAAHDNGVTYLATYVKNSGASKTYYMGLGSDDYCKTWLDTSPRGYKSTASGVGYDQVFQGPFTMGTGWHRLVVKVENGTSAHGAYFRFANADRTALTGIGDLSFAISDATAPTNPTATVTGTSDTPEFTFADAADPEVAGQGVSGVKGFRVYFGTDPAGVPSTFQTAWTFSPGTQAAGTYYLRVKTVDNALNESAVADVFTFVSVPPVVVKYGLSNKATLDAAVAAASATKSFTVWGKVTLIDADSFTVDDGSGVPVTVVKTAHGFADGDYVSATGTLTVTAGTPSIAAATVTKQN